MPHVTPARTTLPSAAFHDGQRWHVCRTPVATLRITADDVAGLRTLPQQVQALLALHPESMAIGLISYEAARGLHAPDCARPTPLPTAVVHIYTHTDDALGETGSDDFRLAQPFQADWSRDQYLSAMARIQTYLAAGDCYQVNLAQRFRARFTGSPWAGWRRLLAAHPAPHACFMDYGEGQVFGVSPERFLSIRQGKMVTEPIKGSQPRGDSPHEDAAFGRTLLASEKDRAENLMIVDLLRNDLGQVAVPGSVRAAPLFELRRFSNVQHLVSTVTAELRPDVTPLAALLACFPGGSITGAPKRRAMQIITELEGSPRGFYCGSLFWQKANGDFDSNILIRTLQSQAGEIICHGGGGIVHDSDPEQEYRESLFKVEKLMAALSASPPAPGA
ncbi:aminodeoxychorismate synthase component I [Alcanivorax sp. JB21]|uniref:aminodeoxychorismate synthase component I n=1 Tax=Alcanivorax limicola TaxID=2874102 RepID=UPI001CBD3DF2|nr:aminodeoxychorismate synthase component I [Alcanivorax limicola]MBZ2187947.1 aminodeoxychorismate synthase component I [Alcanivorax limicola]